MSLCWFTDVFKWNCPPLTGLADAQWVLCGVEHLIFILFIDDLALAQIRSEFGRVEDACELVPYPLHAIPKLLTALLWPLGSRLHLLLSYVCLLCPNCDTCKRPKITFTSSSGSLSTVKRTVHWQRQIKTDILDCVSFSVTLQPWGADLQTLLMSSPRQNIFAHWEFHRYLFLSD